MMLEELQYKEARAALDTWGDYHAATMEPDPAATWLEQQMAELTRWREAMLGEQGIYGGVAWANWRDQELARQVAWRRQLAVRSEPLLPEVVPIERPAEDDPGGSAFMAMVEPAQLTAEREAEARALALAEAYRRVPRRRRMRHALRRLRVLAAE